MVVGYLRVSTEKQRIENQRDEIIRYAEENGLIVDTWISEVVSGKKQASGRKLGRTISKLKKGDTLIVTEVSRLSRTLTDILSVMGKCIQKGVNLYTTKERYRFDDSINSKILCFAFGLVAEIERNLISLRTKEALALRKAEGKVLGRKKGFTPKMEILQKNEVAIRKMLSEGKQVSAICNKYGVSRDTYYKFRRTFNR